MVQTEKADDTYDIVVLGAGGAGMAAALFAALSGMKTLLVERTKLVGGTTALSGGTVWVPNTHHAKAAGVEDLVEDAAKYLRTVMSNFCSEELLQAFLANGPEAVALLDRETDVKLRLFPFHPDYEFDVDGAKTVGRALETVPFDGRLLGKDFAMLRSPIPEFTILGGMMIDRMDIPHLLKMRKSWPSFLYSAKLVARHLRDRMSHPRGTRLVMGNAFIARLLLSLRKRQVPIWLDSRADLIQMEDGVVRGITVTRTGSRQRLAITKGLILGTGGFNRNEKLRSELLPEVKTFSPTAPGATGEALVLALAAGGRLGERRFDTVLWAPVSTRQRKDGSTAVFPHFVLDRGKPGTIVVNAAGRRFVNETTSYHQFGHAMVEANRQSPCIPAFLIADSHAVKKYGIGMVRPGAIGLARHLACGYVIEGSTLAELAKKLGVDSDGLAASVAEINAFAKTGHDPKFGRGSTIYNRNMGDPTVGPNPTLGPIEKPPFYAVRIYPGDIGASTGLVTDGSARVLDGSNVPIAGLYAVGNDMNSVMGGTYPGPGITLGPGVAFAYAAVKDAAKRS